jgi:hypothetical protein
MWRPFKIGRKIRAYVFEKDAHLIEEPWTLFQIVSSQSQ